ncbi:MAG: cytochrome c maturation protein CcmE [Armatimonadota bacterium]|nr:cytochrome c maturation protein CcmE [Armatimonadota bacterium]MDR7437886.1 cytochrome c maturation protein CcmE [Armatimonadota bacterium]MDR7473300.1 cytochrome c maturation protein CcmE [Armatimonadota bacterium]
MSRPHGKILLAVVVFAAVGGYLAFSGARSSLTYYVTVSELLDRASTLSGAPLRLGGTVAPGSVRWDRTGGRLEFHVTDGVRRIPVTYRGVVPDTFRPGGEVVVEGSYDGGRFVAERLFAKCPSKFDATGSGGTQGVP